MNARNPPLFEVRDLAAGAGHAIGPLSFVLETGGCLSLCGPSGAGKSRLLRAMADLDPHAGDCLLAGAEAQHFAAHEWRRKVGYLAAESSWWHERVGAHFPVGTNSVMQHGLTALDLPHDVLDRPAAELSSGQRQRLALLRLLAGEPQVLLLDEPTASLDADNIARVERLVADYRQRHGAAVVWVGHDATQRRRVAHQHMALAANGQVVR